MRSQRENVVKETSVQDPVPQFHTDCLTKEEALLINYNNTHNEVVRQMAEQKEKSGSEEPVPPLINQENNKKLR